MKQRVLSDRSLEAKMIRTEWGKARVLVVDYDQDSLNELKAILSDGGYEVAAVRTAREGLEQMEGRAFDVVLADLLLADMSCLDLLSEIKGRAPQVKVFIMGTHITPAVILESVNRGAFDVVYKPFLASAIIPKLEHLLSQEPPIRPARDRGTV